MQACPGYGGQKEVTGHACSFEVRWLGSEEQLAGCSIPLALCVSHRQHGLLWCVKLHSKCTLVRVTTGGTRRVPEPMCIVTAC
jgi:hypothetical protein